MTLPQLSFGWSRGHVKNCKVSELESEKVYDPSPGALWLFVPSHSNSAARFGFGHAMDRWQLRISGPKRTWVMPLRLGQLVSGGFVLKPPEVHLESKGCKWAETARWIWWAKWMFNPFGRCGMPGWSQKPQGSSCLVIGWHLYIDDVFCFQHTI